MTTPIAAERALLLETMRQVGPDAPTAVAAWRAIDVGRHLVAQDRWAGAPVFAARMVAATGARIGGGHRRADTPGAAAWLPGPATPWDEVLQGLARPPAWLLSRPPVATLTLWEHVLHHEEVRRANGIDRAEAPDLANVLAWLLRYDRRRLGDVQVEVRSDSGGVWRAGDGTPVTLSGPPVDLVLWLSGASAAAHVRVDGDPDAAAALARRLAG